MRGNGAIAATVSLVLGSLLASPASAATSITYTVPRGITTTDLRATGSTALSLAQSLVAAGSGDVVSNAASFGENFQLGTVTALDPHVLGFNNGVALSTGKVASIAGPNGSESWTTVAAGNSDTDLTALVTARAGYLQSSDAASLEFDVTPSSGTLYMTYVFASDDYPERGANYTDVFGIFVTDGSGRTVNCAKVPSGKLVNATTVNAVASSSLFRGNSYGSPPANPIGIEADGLTVELVCAASVTPGVRNHIKVAIADAGDQVGDSWVVLKAGSLSSVAPESCNDGVDNNGDGLVDLDGTAVAAADPACTSSTTPAPVGASGIGAYNAAPAFTGYVGQGILLDDNIFGATPADLDPVNPPDLFTWGVSRKGGPGKCTVAPSTSQPLTGTSLPVASAACQAPGNYTADLVATRGNSTVGHWYTDFTVLNGPPSVTITAPTADQYFDAGAAVTVSAPMVDPAGDALTCSVNWGTDTYWYPGVIAGGVCTATHTYSVPSRYPIAITATDAAGVSSGASQVVSVGKVEQSITVTQEPPASAPKLSRFTVTATGGDSGQEVVYGSDGGCTNIGNVYTMTSATQDCEVSIDQGGSTSTTPQYYPAQTVIYSVSAGPAAPTPLALPTVARRARPFIVARVTAEGSPTTVQVAGACRVSRVFVRRSNGVRFRWFTVTGTRRGQCYVTVSADAIGDYATLLQTSRVRIR